MWASNAQARPPQGFVRANMSCSPSLYTAASYSSYHWLPGGSDPVPSDLPHHRSASTHSLEVLWFFAPFRVNSSDGEIPAHQAVSEVPKPSHLAQATAAQLLRLILKLDVRFYSKLLHF